MSIQSDNKIEFFVQYCLSDSYLLYIYNNIPFLIVLYLPVRNSQLNLNQSHILNGFKLFKCSTANFCLNGFLIIQVFNSEFLNSGLNLRVWWFYQTSITEVSEDLS